MSDGKMTVAMNQAVIQTFGEMAFLDVLPQDGIISEHSQIMVLEITRPERGVLYMLMPKECKQNVVENIHGDSWDALSPGQIDDCLLELLNVLGGTFLSYFYGENVTYSLSFPQVIFDDSEMPDLTDFKLYTYDAEGSAFSIALQFEHPGENA